MEITKEGMDSVNTLAFAEKCRRFIREWRATGKPEEQGKKYLITAIALELAGRAHNPPSKNEFEQFVNDYLIEINRVLEQCLGHLMTNDAANYPVQ